MTSYEAVPPKHGPIFAVRPQALLVKTRRISQEDGVVDQAVHTLPSLLDRIRIVLVVGGALMRLIRQSRSPGIMAWMPPWLVCGWCQAAPFKVASGHPRAVCQGSCARVSLARTARPTISMPKAHKRPLVGFDAVQAKRTCVT